MRPEDPTAADDRVAIAIARHLIGEPPSPDEIARWRQAVEVRDARLSRERDRRLWAWIRRAAWLTGPIDAGLALTDPHSPVRERLYLMLAILEASPAHTRSFLPRETGRLALLALMPRMVAAAFRSALGVMLVGAATALWP